MTRALFLPCAGGAESLLAAEVSAIAGTAADTGRGGVWVAGDEGVAMALNLHSRIAQRVLWPLIDGPYRDEHDLYDLARRVRWGDWITPRQTLRVDVSAQRSPLRSLNFATLRIKDAVCDTLRETAGDRPGVDTQRPDLAVALFVGPEHATLYADTSGEPLFKRGWRTNTGEAPLKETLAAALLSAAGWHGREQDGPLLDPCCGAGTIAIEAAQLACGIAPGSRRRFAFERLLPFSDHLPAWQRMLDDAQSAVHAPRVPVFAGDVSFRMTDFAARNAVQAGVADAIGFKTVDALQRPPPAPGGTMILNPPYGERIDAKGSGAREAAPADFFAALAAHWKRHYAGWTAWLLSPDMKLPTAMRLKESRRVPMRNGPIECRLFRFDMVAGPNKETA